MDFDDKFVLLLPTCFPSNASISVRGEDLGVSIKMVQKEQSHSVLCFLWHTSQDALWGLMVTALHLSEIHLTTKKTKQRQAVHFVMIPVI